ncbi:MAG: hypothetical protein JSU95_12295 [Betaproteobacteria bacterium]|nr:MAG: hypothetical protein JSU95_12295 [Betaproteobacteria bacterium]
MRALTGVLFLFAGLLPQALAETWVEVGADTEAKFYIDVDSIAMVEDTLHVIKRGIYTHTLTERMEGSAVVFKETRGLVELDCALRVNRITRIDMLDETGEVVWSSGHMPRRLWLSVKPNSHAEATLDVACAHFRKT